ncbi:DoxX family membrane protein [Bdellovibrio svalbardensis]|uniref:DoxX family membrane protein n=1 Tax=Bdellovibrio svalbardensis TaxID=2972972 RepID=A0ABT6DGE1_9BACT|nr:DoxX family membrane protein [Bdellovibrio svalbardensis]MDG0815878.1 DoxX family membrane protein [Bdellovibrio svalbardensis]
MTTLSPQELAYTLLRFALGLNIFLHGAVRLGSNYQKFIDWTTGLFQNTPLPSFAVQAFAHSIPILEVTFGLLILLGLFTLPALIGGTLVMIGLMAGMCIIQNWEIVGIQMIYIFLYTVLTFTLTYNGLSIDRFLIRK